MFTPKQQGDSDESVTDSIFDAYSDSVNGMCWGCFIFVCGVLVVVAAILSLSL